MGRSATRPVAAPSKRRANSSSPSGGAYLPGMVASSGSKFGNDRSTSSEDAYARNSVTIASRSPTVLAGAIWKRDPRDMSVCEELRGSRCCSPAPRHTSTSCEHFPSGAALISPVGVEQEGSCATVASALLHFWHLDDFHDFNP